MNLWLLIPSMNAERLAHCVDVAMGAATRPERVKLLLFGNGVDLKTPYAIHSPVNVGVTKALHHMYEIVQEIGASTDILLFIHDDVEITEKGWDLRLLKFFKDHPKAGLVGFGGAKGLGDPDLYQKPYQLIQLARRDFVSNMRHAEAHGRRETEPLRVATVDGFSLACRRAFLDEIKGFSWWPFPHHGYDNGLALQAARRGWETWMLPVQCHHHGGLTATGVDYQKDFGQTEGEIHAAGHMKLYDNFRDVLPLRVET